MQHQQRFFLFTGFLLAASEICKQWYLTFQVNDGAYLWWNFPFQLCSIAMYILLALPWVKSQKLRGILLHFLMCYSLLGGIAAFADTTGMHYPVLWLTIHSYLWHILLILVGLAAGIIYISEGYQTRRHSFFYTTLMYLICCLLAELINYFVNPFGIINMFYINPHYLMDQAVFRNLVPYIGNKPAICAYIAATIVGAWLLHLLWQTQPVSKILQTKTSAASWFVARGNKS